MTAELVRGQNHPLTQARLQIRVSAGTPVVAMATTGDDRGRVAGPDGVAHPGAPCLPGLQVSRQAAATHRIAVDLDAVDQAVHRVEVLLVLPGGVLPGGGGGPTRFGAVAAPFVSVAGPDGTELAGCTLTGLDAESAVIALELYRRQGAWKVRAVGQGYAGGLVELLTDRGLPRAHDLAHTVHEAVTRGTARPPAADGPPRTADPERRPPHAPEPAPTPHPARGAGPHTTPAPPHDAGPASPAAVGGDETHRTEEPTRAGLPVPGDTRLPRPPASQGAVGADPSADPPPAPARGPVDYRHPRRQPSSAPPAHPSGPLPASPPPQPLPPTAPAAPPGRPAPPVAGDAAGRSMDERLYNQVWGMFEDLARATAAYRGAVDFADARRARELDEILSDPRGRTGGQAEAAREAVRARHTQLVDRARAALDRDLAQLAAEAEVVEPALPPAYAGWDHPVWHGYRVPTQMPTAMRLGDLHLPESPSLRIPLLVRLPLERGLWIDSGRSGRPGDPFADPGRLRELARETAVAHAARLLAVHPAGEFAVHVIDPAGEASQAFAPLVRAGVLAGPPATGATGVADVLTRLTQRVDLVQMAVRAGAPDALPPHLDTAGQLLVVHDFPHGFDERAVTRLRYLADEGPAVGVHLMLVADREDAAAYGPLLDPLWRALLRLTPVADDHLADPWVGHAWTYEPPGVPSGSQVLDEVLTRVARAQYDASA
ncbi:TerD family protein [Streptomyces mexicanus]